MPAPTPEHIIAAEIVSFACIDALEFGTELRVGYVQAGFECRYGREYKGPEQEPLLVRQHLEKLGFIF